MCFSHLLVFWGNIYPFESLMTFFLHIFTWAATTNCRWRYHFRKSFFNNLHNKLVIPSTIWGLTIPPTVAQMLVNLESVRKFYVKSSTLILGMQKSWWFFGRTTAVSSKISWKYFLLGHKRFPSSLMYI